VTCTAVAPAKRLGPMRELHHAGGSVIVSFDVCEAVLSYALALSLANKADIVTIPVLVDGGRGDSRMLLGPSSQLFCTPAPDVDVDLDDADAIAEMELRGRLIGPTRAVSTAMTAVPDYMGEFE
jgi:hypothetical protein